MLVVSGCLGGDLSLLATHTTCTTQIYWCHGSNLLDDLLLTCVAFLTHLGAKFLPKVFKSLRYLLYPVK